MEMKMRSDAMDDGEEMDEGEEEGEEEEGDWEGDEEQEEYALESQGEMLQLYHVEPQPSMHSHYEKLTIEKKRKPLHGQCSADHAKKTRQDDFDAILESMNHRRKSRKLKKRGREKGSKNKLNPEITKKLGEASLHFAFGRYHEAIPLLEEVVRAAPYLPDAHHTLGLIWDSMGERKKAMSLYMIAALLADKNSTLWKHLISWFIEQGYTGLVKSCLKKAITADPEDIGLRFTRASLYVELGDYRNAAKLYEQITAIWPAKIEAYEMAVQMYQRCGQYESAIRILDKYLEEHSTEVDLRVVNLLVSLNMQISAHAKALEVIKRARSAYFSNRELPLCLTVKDGICQMFLGYKENTSIPEIISDVHFQSLFNSVEDNGNLIIEVADSFRALGHYDSALRYYLSLEGTSHGTGSLQLKISKCYLSLKERENAIPFFYKALSKMEKNIDARIMLSSVLLEEQRFDEAIILLSPPKHLADSEIPVGSKPWWVDGRVKIQLAKIYHGRGMLQEFVDVILLPIQETLLIAHKKRKAGVKGKIRKRRLTNDVLLERAKLLDIPPDFVFRGSTPIAAPSEIVKASRAKKLLEQRAAAGVTMPGAEWEHSGSNNSIQLKELQEPPLPDLLEDEEQYSLLLDLCRALASLQRDHEALEVITHSLKITFNIRPVEKKEELLSLGAQIAYNATHSNCEPELVQKIVRENHDSCAAWNVYYMAISRLDNQLAKDEKFLRSMQLKHKECVYPLIIHGHQFTLNCRHQDAAEKYLNAYKLQPGNPLILLCAGTALINLALGFRLKNKHLTVLQGIGLLYEYMHICSNSQEALYNVARAYHHVGLVTLAASYYEKVLATQVKDCRIQRRPDQVLSYPETRDPGTCSLHREAAYNLHLIYKKSGAVDLARQVLRSYCVT